MYTYTYIYIYIYIAADYSYGNKYRQARMHDFLFPPGSPSWKDLPGTNPGWRFRFEDSWLQL